MEKEKFVEKLVWTRMKYCPFWPARIVDPPPIIGKVANGKQCVLFFGTKEYGIVDDDKIEDYTINREQFCAKGKGADFKIAVRQMDEYISNPTKFRSHAYVKPAKQNLPLKTERDIENRLKIKCEPKTTKTNSQTESKRNIGSKNDLKIKCESKTIANTWEAEKKTLIDKIVTLKSENHHNILTLKRTQSELSSMLLEKQKLDMKWSEREMKMKNLQLELMNAKNELAEREQKCEKIISNLKHENQTLAARMKQYMAGMTEKKKIGNAISQAQKENQEFEVEAIIDHKITKGGRLYLIRWKGFDSTEDSWEKESNLSCPKLLNKYNKSGGINK